MKVQARMVHILCLLFLLSPWMKARASNRSAWENIYVEVAAQKQDTTIFQQEKDSSSTKIDSAKISSLLNAYLTQNFHTDSISAYLLQIGESHLHRQEEGLRSAYHQLLSSAISAGDISKIKNWRSYLNKLSPSNLASGLPFQLQGKNFSHTGIVINEQGQLRPSYFGNGYNLVNNLSVSDQVSIKNIPVSIRFIRQDMSGNPYVSRNVFSSSFNRGAFLQDMRKRLKQTIKPSDIFPDDHLLELMHEGVENMLRRQIDSIISNAKLTGSKYLQQFAHPEDLLDKDMSSLSRQIFSEDYLEYIQSRKNILQRLQHKLNNGRFINKKLMDSVTSQVKEFDKLRAIYKKVADVKQKWENDKLVQKLKQLRSLKDQKFEELLNDPATLKQLASKYLPLKGMDKLFLNINSLDVGQHVSNLSPLSLQNFLSNGASIAVEKKNKYMMLIAGKEKSLDALYDMQSFLPLFSGGNKVLGGSFGIGDPSSDHTHITIMTYDQTHSKALNTSSLLPERNSIVTGLDNQFTIAENTVINLEISKSAMQYKNASGIDGNSATTFGKLTNMENTKGSTAAMIRMRGNYRKIGLNMHTSLSLVSKGYYNPGNIYLSRGTKELNFGARKTFFKRRVTLNAHGDIRRYNFSTDGKSKGRSSFFSLQGRWNSGKGSFIAINYQPTRYKQIIGNKKMISGITDRLQLTGSFHQRILGFFYRNMMSLGYSKDRYDWDTTGRVNRTSLLFTSMQSVILHHNLLYMNITYNHANTVNNLVYFNTTFTSELGYTYKIGKKVNATSGIQYNAVEMWHRQLGIRQSLSVDINSKLQLSLFMDLKKNIKEYHTAYFNDLYRANWNLHYSF